MKEKKYYQYLLNKKEINDELVGFALYSICSRKVIYADKIAKINHNYHYRYGLPLNLRQAVRVLNLKQNYLNSLLKRFLKYYNPNGIIIEPFADILGHSKYSLLYTIGGFNIEGALLEYEDIEKYKDLSTYEKRIIKYAKEGKSLKFYFSEGEIEKVLDCRR